MSADRLFDYVPVKEDWRYLDLFFGLLAGENLTVRRCNAKTASIDLKSRVIMIPNFATEDKDILLLMGSHEVSHALNTPRNWCHDELNKVRNARLRMCINIVEDIRIEKLIRRKFPGFVTVYQRAYKKLFASDFFSLKSWNSFGIADKVNAYAKLGKLLPQKLTPHEMCVYRYIAKAESFQDVLVRAFYLYDMTSKVENEKPDSPKANKKNKPDDEPDDEPDVEHGEAPSETEEGEGVGEPSEGDDDGDSDIPGKDSGEEPDAGDIEKATKNASGIKSVDDLNRTTPEDKNDKFESKTEKELDKGRSDSVKRKPIVECLPNVKSKAVRAAWLSGSAQKKSLLNY